MERVLRAPGLGRLLRPAKGYARPYSMERLRPRCGTGSCKRSLASGRPKPRPNGHVGRIDKSVLTFSEPRRYRDKGHVKFVASRACLVCGRRPCDPHHLRFAQPPALGRKVSDEFTVPLCRVHHRELHRSRNETLWWKKLGIDPIKIAGQLWDRTRSRRLPETGTPVALPASALPPPDTGAKGGAGRAAR